MNVADVLTESFDEVAPLRRPVLVVALGGWFDASDVATDAVLHLVAGRVATIVGSIDPDPFFDFTQERPHVEIDEAEVRHLRWPSNELRVVRIADAPHDLVVLAGVEPHLRYATFAECIVTTAQALRCEMAVTVGATAEPVSHTRPPHVVASSTDGRLAASLGASPPRYQGMTGLIGVLLERLERAGLPTISLRVGVPHYLGNARHPRHVAALLAQLARVLGVPVGADRLGEEIARWQQLHDEAVADDPDAAAYVRMLELDHDRRLDETAGQLTDDLDRFLRDPPDDDPTT